MNEPELVSPATPEATADAAEKPKRRRAPRKATVPADGSAAPAPDPAAAASMDTGPAPAPRVAEPAPADPSAAAEPGEPGEPAGAGNASTEGAVDGAAAAGSRRGRNRRRGRRNAERRADAPAGMPAAPEAAAEALFASVLSGDFDPAFDAPLTLLPAPGSLPDDTRELAPPEAVQPVESDESPAAPALAAGAEAGPGAAAATVGAAERRVLAPDPDAPKLQKVLAQSGVGSRRDIEQWIAEGKVVVNGEPAHVGQRVARGDRILVNGKPVRFRIAPPRPQVLAYHKPAGEVVTHDDPQQRPTVFRRLPRLQHGKWQSVGRLDINTEGLLLFTNSGELANQLMHPRFGVEREYAVRSLGVLGEEAKARLLEGVEIDGQRCAFKSIADGGGEGANHWYRCVITEGRNREVRRLFESVGHAVSRLIRIRYGSVVLPRGLKRGVWVALDEFDLKALRRLAQPGPAVPGAGPGTPPAGGKRRQRAPESAGDAVRDDALEHGPPPGWSPDRATPAGRKGRNRRGKAGAGESFEQPPRLPRERGEGGTERRYEPEEGGAIPSPLLQTYDKRAFQQERQQKRELSDDGPIPNPLQQTYDKRALQRERATVRDIPEDGPIPNPLQQTYDRRFAGGAGPGGKGGPRGGKAGGPGGKRSGAKADPSQIPDPMQTSVGYIGADALHRKGKGGGKGRGGARGNRPKTGGAAAHAGPGGPSGGARGRRGGGRGGRGPGGGGAKP